jgi:hypothetical protein
MFTDGTTEPIIAIIGHPIAGNPSQLAIERSLHAMGLEWRVLSFDVTPMNVAKALDGFSVTGIAGVMIAANLQNAAAQWYSEYVKTPQPDEPTADPSPAQAEVKASADAQDSVSEQDSTSRISRINCLHRGEPLGFLGSNQQVAYAKRRLADRSVNHSLWLGRLPNEEQRDCWPSQWNLFSKELSITDMTPESIAAADLIVLADIDDSDVEEVDFDDWPSSDGTTMVIDLNGTESLAERLKRRGYEVVTCIELQVGMLAGCIEKWTQQQAPTEMIAEAIEEYFGV